MSQLVVDAPQLQIAVTLQFKLLPMLLLFGADFFQFAFLLVEKTVDHLRKHLLHLFQTLFEPCRFQNPLLQELRQLRIAAHGIVQLRILAGLVATQRNQLPDGLIAGQQTLEAVCLALVCGVEGMLMDASQNGMGILVQERVALASRCTVEVLAPERSQMFQAEVCYATRTDEGIRLGILLDESNDPPILEFLKEMDVELL